MDRTAVVISATEFHLLLKGLTGFSYCYSWGAFLAVLVKF